MRQDWSEIKREIAALALDEMLIVEDVTERKLKDVLRHWKNRPADHRYRMVTGEQKLYVIRVR